MNISFGNKGNNFFVVFIVGVIVSYGIFVFVQQLDKRDVVTRQLDIVQEQLVKVEIIYTNCLSLYHSGESVPQRVREACVESQGFVSWVRGFSYEPQLKNIKAEFFALAKNIEDLTRTLSLHPNSVRGRELLDNTPESIQAIREEVIRVQNKILF